MIRLGLLIAFAMYVLSGCYVVGSHEQAVVQRFGRMVAEQRASGLHWDLPRPFATIERVNVTALHTLSVGIGLPTSAALLPKTAQHPLFVLTGDENILRLRASVQYRIEPESVRSFLFGHQNLSAELQALIESTLIESSAQSGVDFVLTSGMGPLNTLLSTRLRRSAAIWRLGIEIDSVTLDAVDPPAPVLSDFLDVANARSEAAQVIQQARTFAEQRSTAAVASAQEAISKARGERRAASVAAQAAADRFGRLVDEFQRSARLSQRTYGEQRDLAVRRLTRELHRDLLTAGVRTWVIDAEEPVDLQFRRLEP